MDLPYMDDGPIAIFDELLRGLAETDEFAVPESPSIFVIYAHDSVDMGTANSDFVRKIISWLQVLRTFTLSDMTATRPLLTREYGEAATTDIVSNQFCLLPASGNDDKIGTIKSVDKVLIFGSEVLKEYYESDFTKPYIKAIRETFAQAEAEHKPRAELRDMIEKTVDSYASCDKFHHVLTELAFVQIRCSHHSTKATGVIPIALNENLMQYLPYVKTRTVVVKLGSDAACGRLERLLFKILQKLYPNLDELINDFQKCYSIVNEQLQMGEKGDNLSRILSREITKAIKNHQHRIAAILRETKLRLERDGQRQTGPERHLGFNDLHERSQSPQLNGSLTTATIYQPTSSSPSLRTNRFYNNTFSSQEALLPTTASERHCPRVKQVFAPYSCTACFKRLSLGAESRICFETRQSFCDHCIQTPSHAEGPGYPLKITCPKTVTPDLNYSVTCDSCKRFYPGRSYRGFRCVRCRKFAYCLRCYRENKAPVHHNKCTNPRLELIVSTKVPG